MVNESVGTVSNSQKDELMRGAGSGGPHGCEPIIHPSLFEAQVARNIEVDFPHLEAPFTAFLDQQVLVATGQ